MNEIGIICLLPDGIRSYQRDLRQKIATQFGLSAIANPVIPAHLTIKYRFPVRNLDEIEKAVQEFCLVQSKTKVSLHGFNYFKNDDIMSSLLMSLPPKKPEDFTLISLINYEKSIGYNGASSTMPIYTTMSLWRLKE